MKTRIVTGTKDTHKSKPSIPTTLNGDEGVELRVTLAAPPWSSLGWEEHNPGFVYWYCSQRQGMPPKILFGKRMLAQIRTYHEERAEKIPRATHVTLIAHRFAKGKGRSETPKDKVCHKFGR